jgi:phosphopantothenoylcysteine decarboxylase/phosphopantothenate--cysteine ligase
LKILVTSGPTREYIDPVRFLSNASSGKMGAAIAIALLELGFKPIIVSGPVDVNYPADSIVHKVETTDEMLSQCLSIFDDCIGVIGAAAPCDYKPQNFSLQKIAKSESGKGITVKLEQTKDILAALGKIKRKNQISVGFALETEQGKTNAASKLKRKKCDFIVLNSPESLNSDSTNLQVFNSKEELIAVLKGTKIKVAKKLIELIYLPLKF